MSDNSYEIDIMKLLKTSLEYEKMEQLLSAIREKCLNFKYSYNRGKRALALEILKIIEDEK